MTDNHSCRAVLVAYRSWPWTAVAVSSFQEWFPDLPLLVVDNNVDEGDPVLLDNCRRERQWLARRPNLQVLPNTGPDRFHGSGIDVALRHCRDERIDFLLHFEPDCLVAGSKWFDALARPLQGGAWMSGMWRHFYGPFHPTPSIWRVDVAWDSFCRQPRRDDVRHTRFAELFRLPDLLEHARNHEPQVLSFWEESGTHHSATGFWLPFRTAPCWSTTPRIFTTSGSDPKGGQIRETRGWRGIWTKP